MQPMIHPTHGRVVWYSPGQADEFTGSPVCAALVCHVHTDRLVNLAVFDTNGHAHSRQNVTLLQEEDLATPGEAYAAWMPYQAGQAAKTEAAEAAAKTTKAK